MGFYQPAQLVRDAREHGVTVQQPDINRSNWACTLEPLPAPPVGAISKGDARAGQLRTGPQKAPQDAVLAEAAQERRAVRLGLCLISGLAEEATQQTIVANRGDGYSDILSLWLRTGASMGIVTVLSRVQRARAMRWASLPLVLLLIAGYAAFTGRIRHRLMSHSMEPFRESVEMTRATLNPNAAENQRIITASSLMFPLIYDPLMIFYTDSQPGRSDKPIEAHHKGSETLSNLSTHRKAQFETAPFKLEKEELDGGWFYRSGGDGRARDRVTGIWVRAYTDGNLVGEYANPSTLTKNKEWED